MIKASSHKDYQMHGWSDLDKHNQRINYYRWISLWTEKQNQYVNSKFCQESKILNQVYKHIKVWEATQVRANPRTKEIRYTNQNHQ